jgi:hypothetical protein
LVAEAADSAGADADGVGVAAGAGTGASEAAEATELFGRTFAMAGFFLMCFFAGAGGGAALSST